MHFIGSGHIPLEHTETLQESPDLILALLDFAPEILGLARLLAWVIVHMRNCVPQNLGDLFTLVNLRKIIP